MPLWREEEDQINKKHIFFVFIVGNVYGGPPIKYHVVISFVRFNISKISFCFWLPEQLCV